MAEEGDIEELEQLVMQFARLVTVTLRERGVGGLSLSQIQVLKRLCHKDERASDLAVSLGVTPAAVTKLIDQLAERGMVQRSPSRTDRRSAAVSITKTGKVALEKSRHARSAMVRRFLEPLEKEEAVVLARALRRMVDVLPAAWLEG
jgi:DNA-binding MarR family transcriptional regulator